MVGVGSRVADSVPWIFRWVENTEHSDSYSSNTLRIPPSFPPSHSTTPPSHTQTAVGHLCQRPLTAPPPTQRSHRSYMATPSLRRSRRRRSCSGRAQSAPSSSASSTTTRRPRRMRPIHRKRAPRGKTMRKRARARACVVQPAACGEWCAAIDQAPGGRPPNAEADNAITVGVAAL